MYLILRGQHLVASRRNPLLCCYRASPENKTFVIKNMTPGEYKYQQDLQKQLSSCPNLRTVVDGLPGPELFIYPFLQTDCGPVILHPGKYIGNGLRGNQMWRSPESGARSIQGTPLNIFSFGIVPIYVVLKEMGFCVTDEELAADDSWRHLKCHISFFVDEDGLNSILQWTGLENPFFERIMDPTGSFEKEGEN
ncbi:calcium/calmodulin dependent protein kinase [Amylocarpus encephaloides]|uniref:Calcium/calmodulin dependent protein kinase n=1 Tax=Amylocarpus encephaloides TaxID=45428 RepID=A0A9P7YI03_9HELO|nr:calcium/calmodulin dependent protein kinase [Amylocarpus encephaloides]